MNPKKLRVDPPSLKLQPSHRAPARRDGATRHGGFVPWRTSDSWSGFTTASVFIGLPRDLPSLDYGTAREPARREVDG